MLQPCMQFTSQTTYEAQFCLLHTKYTSCQQNKFHAINACMKYGIKSIEVQAYMKTSVDRLC